MAKILGLDISSVSTGHCIIDNGRLIKSTTGIIAPSPKISLAEKLVYFEGQLALLIDTHKPSHVVVEDIFRGPSIKTFKTLAMFRGVCFATVYKLTGKEPVSIMPTEARKLVGTKGSKKEDGFAFVIDKYSFPNYTFESHSDITDSIILALACHTMIKLGIDTNSQARRRKKKLQK